METAHPSEDRDTGFLRSTLFQIWSRNQMSLISLADRKANVIAVISIVLITVIILLFSAGKTSTGDPVVSKLEFLIPLSVMMGFMGLSALCAILALKPKIIRSTRKQSRGILFFHNFYRKSLEDYRGEMRAMLESKEDVYDQLVTNMYYNGLVLERKYALLGLSYTIFLLAWVCGLTAFIVVAVT